MGLYSTVAVPKALYNGLKFTHTPLGAIQALFSCPRAQHQDWDGWGLNRQPLSSALRPEQNSPNRDEVDLNKYNRLDQTGRKVTAPATRTESLPDSALFTEKAAQMNECDDAAPRIARRKSNVTVVTSYGAHFSSRLAFVM